MKITAQMKILPALLAATIITLGCAHAGGVASRQNERTFCARSPAPVYVENDNWMDVVVYAVRGGSRFRLGMVTSIQSAVFELPSATLGASTSLFLLASPIGGSRYDLFATDDIMLAPGHTIIDLRLDNVMSHSSWSVAVEDPQDT
jgi:hypothetical protein